MKARLLVLALFVAGCTQQMAVQQLGDSKTLQDFSSNLKAIKLEDLKAADARAVAANDQIGHACYPVLIKYVDQGLPGVTGGVAGVFDAFEAARLGANQFQAGLPDDLRLGCSALVMDVQALALRLGAIAGSRGVVR